MSSYNLTIVATLNGTDLPEHTLNLEVTDQVFDEEVDEFTNQVEMYTDEIHVGWRIIKVDDENPEQSGQFIAHFIKDGNLDEKFWDWQAAMSDSSYGEEVWEAAYQLGIPPEDVDEAYQGEYRSDEDFAYQMAEDLGLLKDDAQWPYTAIDWRQAARDLLMDYCEDSGQYFRRM